MNVRDGRSGGVKTHPADEAVFIILECRHLIGRIGKGPNHKNRRSGSGQIGDGSAREVSGRGRRVSRCG